VRNAGISGTYRAWVEIDYRPAVDSFFPEALASVLSPGARILELGCNTGKVAVWLAEKGFRLVGLDINTQAIDEAKLRAVASGCETQVEFVATDFLEWQEGEMDFDAVSLIRLLTCIPDRTHWESCLARAVACLRPGGLLYVDDFLMDPEGTTYRDRYQAGAAKGWREGNFAVNDESGSLQFVAHHHTEAEVAFLDDLVEQEHFLPHYSTSMNGNPCLMFGYIGRKRQP
jgi:cyclopropane fatty-acyl-phospholipid synthase-like methyltransferase